MPLTITPFDPTTHLAAAAALLAARHARDRVHDPRLPARFNDAAACRPLIEAILADPTAHGVVAESDGAVVGFAIMTAFLVVPNAGHSVYWEEPDVFNRSVLDFIRRH